MILRQPQHNFEPDALMGAVYRLCLGQRGNFPALSRRGSATRDIRGAGPKPGGSPAAHPGLQRVQVPVAAFYRRPKGEGRLTIAWPW